MAGPKYGWPRSSASARRRYDTRALSPRYGRLRVAIPARLQHRKPFDEPPDSVVERVHGLKARALDLLVRDDIVPFVRILADVRLHEDERREVRLDPLAQLTFRKVGIGE